jgi:tetratricopeptide (TPR) repeat protein/predicted Ser/Thr protein kinase
MSTHGEPASSPKPAVERRVAFDVVGSRLFNLAPKPMSIGRFVVLSTLGRGGMGTVFKAYDESLDRAVAIKLLHSSTSEHHAQRLKREAQALAKLSHPNVVHVYEVGKANERWFIAMELVRGQTLREWSTGEHGWRERVSTYLHAGAGLAAAHAAGLVHRDFKPDNCIIDEQGRARVLDFGLAREAVRSSEKSSRPNEESSEPEGANEPLTQTGAVLGTLAYMPLEQLEGRPADARSDQFSFCVSLYEALYGERPFAGRTPAELCENIEAGDMREVPKNRKVPAWVQAVLVRGLSAAPEERFASMNALLAALAADPSRRNRRRLAVGVGVAVVALLAGSYAANHARRVQTCEDEAASVSDVWNDAARVRAEAGLIASGVSFAPSTWERVEPGLDRYAATWSEIRGSTCIAAEVEGTRSGDLAMRTSECLAEHRDALQVLVDVLADADTMVVSRAVLATAQLPRIEECMDDARLGRRMHLPEDPDMREQVSEVRRKLTRAHGLSDSGRYAEGLALAHEAESEAEGIGWAPLQAEALARVGHETSQLGRFKEAEEILERAVELALREGHEVLAIEALRGLARTTGIERARFERGLWWGKLGLALAVQLGGDDDLRTALALEGIANIHREVGSYRDAKQLQERAHAILEEMLGPDHPNVATSLHNLASIHGDLGAYSEAKALHENALAIRQQALGPDHPQIASSFFGLAIIHSYLGEYTEDRALNERALVILEEALGPKHPDIATGLNNLAIALRTQGAYKEAMASLERAISIEKEVFGPDHPSLATSLGNLAITHVTMGAYAEAKSLAERALAIREKALGSDHPNVSRSLVTLGNILRLTGSYAEAKAHYQRALVIEENVRGPEHKAVSNILDNLAIIHGLMGEHGEAKALFERVLSLNEEMLGRDHPTVAHNLFNLGDVARIRGAYAEGGAYYERALAIHEKVFGPDHEKVASTLTNLAIIHLRTDEYSRAEAVSKRALAIYEKVFGPDHPHIAATLNNLVVIDIQRGSFANAKTHLERMLAINERASGIAHPILVATLCNLAIVHGKLGAYSEAKIAFARAISIQEKAFGSDHPELAMVLANLATTQRDDGAYAEAEANLERAISIQEKAFGPGHPDLAWTIATLGTVHMRTGALVKARTLHEGVLASWEDALGSDHPQLITPLLGLADVMLAQHRAAAAASLAERAVALGESNGSLPTELAQARFTLARAVLEADRDRDRARTLSESARDGYREIGDSTEQAKVEAWLAAHHRELAERR